MSDEPDEVTRAALEAVSEAVELAGESEPSGPARRRRRGRGILDRLGGRLQGIRRISVSLGGTARRSARVTGRRVAAGGRWLSDQVLTMAPRLPLRNQGTLRAQFPGRSPDELADVLIEHASRASAAVGIAVGSWAILPFPPAAGAEIATETLAVVGVEIKLVAELHEVYGLVPPGNRVDRATGYVAAWAQRRGVALAPGGVMIVAGSPLARQLQRRLAARAGRSAFSLGPLLTGAVAGGILNRRETRRLGGILRDDLRKRSPYQGSWPD